MSQTRPRSKKLSRRQYLKTTAAAAGAAFVAPTIIPASALGRGGDGARASGSCSGAIGLGAGGEFDLKWMLREKDVQFVAICDARKVRREAIKQIADKHYGNSDCQMYPEMREFLATRADIDARLDRHRRPLALAGDDHGDAGGQGRLFREAFVHDHRRGPDGRRDRPAVRPHLPDRRPAAQRGPVRDRDRAGPAGTAGPGAHRPRPHRAVGRRRDEPRLAARGAAALQGRSVTGTPGSGPAPGGRTTRPTSRAAGAAITTSTRAASASGAPTRSPNRRPASARSTTSARRIPVREEHHRRRHGRQVRQRRADDPLTRRQVLARVLRNAVRGDRGLGCLRPTATRSRRCRPLPCSKTATSCWPTTWTALSGR